MRYLRIILSIDYFNIELLHCEKEKEKNNPIYSIGNIISETLKLKVTVSHKNNNLLPASKNSYARMQAGIWNSSI